MDYLLTKKGHIFTHYRKIYIHMKFIMLYSTQMQTSTTSTGCTKKVKIKVDVCTGIWISLIKYKIYHKPHSQSYTTSIWANNNLTKTYTYKFLFCNQYTHNHHHYETHSIRISHIHHHRAIGRRSSTKQLIVNMANHQSRKKDEGFKELTTN